MHTRDSKPQHVSLPFILAAFYLSVGGGGLAYWTANPEIRGSNHGQGRHLDRHFCMLHLRPIVKSAMMSTLTAHCHAVGGGYGEGEDWPPCSLHMPRLRK